MRKRETSMLSIGATGAGSTVAGSSARVHPASAKAIASAVRRGLWTPGIGREGSVLAGAFVTDQQREIGGDGNALRLPVALGVELSAAEHASGRVHLGVRVLRAGQQEIGAGAGMADHGGAVELFAAGDPRELALGNDHSRLGLELPGLAVHAQHDDGVAPALAHHLLAEEQEGAGGLVPG